MRKLIQTGYVVKLKAHRKTKKRMAHMLLKDDRTVCKVENGLKDRKGYEVTEKLPEHTVLCKNCASLLERLKSQITGAT